MNNVKYLALIASLISSTGLFAPLPLVREQPTATLRAPIKGDYLKLSHEQLESQLNLHQSLLNEGVNYRALKGTACKSLC